MAGYYGGTTFLWTPSSPHAASGSYVSLASGYQGVANGINNYGQVVYFTEATNTSPYQNFLWTPNAQHGSSGVITNLPAALDLVSAINDMGQAVGTGLWTPSTPNGSTGTYTSLGDLPGGGNETHGYGINASGQVVGFALGTTGTHAILWNPDTPNATTGTLHDLGDFAGGTDYSYATSIILAVQCVGVGFRSPPGPRASSGRLPTECWI